MTVGRLLILAIPVAIAVYAFIDVVTTRGPLLRGPKWLWAIAVLVLPLVGAAGWFLLGRPRRSRPVVRSSAPDDDVDFLRDLNRQMRRDGDEPTAAD
jgi:hypothetical protein